MITSLLINLFVVVLILTIYRNFDKNNRSLETARKFIKNEKEKMIAFLDEQKGELRNLSIDTEVNLKTGTECLNKLREEVLQIETNLEQTMVIEKKLKEYDVILKELHTSAEMVEENLRRIEEESSFVDKVSRKIVEAKDRITKIEKQLPSIHEEFGKVNIQHLDLLKKNVIEEIKKGQDKVKQKIIEGEKQVDGFTVFIKQLDSKRESMEQDMVKNLNHVYKKLESGAQASKSKLETQINERIEHINKLSRNTRTKFEEDMKVVEAKYFKHLQVVADKGLALEHEAFDTVKARIYENSQQFNSELEATFQSLNQQMEKHSSHIQKQMKDHKKEADVFNTNMTNELDVIRKTFDAKFADMKKDINSKIESFILGNREKQKALTAELSSLNQFTEQKIARFKEDFSKSIQDIAGEINNFKTAYSEQLKEAALKGEADRDKLVDEININIHNSRDLLLKDIKALKADISEVDDFREIIDKKIEEIITRYDEGAKEISGKLENFKEEVEKDIEISSHDIEARVISSIEKRLSDYEAEAEYRINKIEEVNVDVNAMEENISALLDARKTDINREFNEYMTVMEEKRQGEENKTRELVSRLNQDMQELENGLNELKDKAYDNVGEKLKVFEDDFFANLKGRSENMELTLNKWQKDIDSRLEKIKTRHIAERNDLEALYSKMMEEKIKDLKAEGDAGLAKIKEEIHKDNENLKVHAEKLTADVSQVCDDVQARYYQFKEQIALDQNQLGEVVHSVKEDMGHWKKEMAFNMNTVQEENTAARKELEEVYNNKLEELYDTLRTEAREEADRISRQFTADREGIAVALNQFRDRVDKYEEDLEKEISGLSEKARAEFAGSMEEVRNEGQVHLLELKNSIAESLNQVRDKVSQLETSITGDCTRIDQQILEVRQRVDEENSSMEKKHGLIQQRFREWQGVLEVRMGNYEEVMEKEIAGLSEKARADFAGSMEEVRNESQAHLQNLKNNIAQSLDQVKEKVSHLGASVTEDCARIDQKILEVDQRIDEQKASMEESRSLAQQQLEEWQGDIDARVSAHTDGFELALHEVKKKLAVNIEALALDFAKQKDDLLVSTNEDRNKIKSDLNDFHQRLGDFDRTLNIRSAETLEEFNQKYMTLKMEFAASINTFQEDTHNRITNFKELMNSDHSELQEKQKKNMARFEAEARSFSEKLKSLDRELKNIIDQNQVFEKADKLRAFLKNSIDELKSSISQLEPEKKKVQIVETEILKTRKAADEVSVKLARFFAEKRRVDGMEKDFKKLIRISEEIEVKLDSVTSAHDTLQELQLKLKDLEKLEQNVESRYDRLEKKQSLVDSTTLEIDKNFQSLESIDNEIKTLESEYRTLPPQLMHLKKELEYLLENQPRVEQVVEKLEGLNSTLEDLDIRMDKLQSAREWLSRTETRLENINKQAGDQMKLMQSLLKEETSSRKGKGAPPPDKRQTIIKLAHQGWSVKEIARATNVSQGEVELILELAPQNR